MSKKTYSAFQEVQMMQLYESGKSMSELADIFGGKKTTVSKMFKRRGFKSRGPRGVTSVQWEKIKPKILDLHIQGLSQSKIAENLNVGLRSVRVVLIQAGLYSGLGAKRGQRHPLWKNGKSVKKDGGYVLVSTQYYPELKDMAGNSLYLLEHRAVMAKHLGRSLQKEETVHHINGDRSDNRIENLQLRKGRHGIGSNYYCNMCGSSDVLSKEI